MVVDGEEEYKVEAILRHKGKGARHLYLVSGRDIPSLRLVGRLNRISEMFF